MCLLKITAPVIDICLAAQENSYVQEVSEYVGIQTRKHVTISEAWHPGNNKIAVPQRNDCKTRKDKKYCITKQGP